jgi:EmrB/QacA subfamily drug resistance transporter
MEISKDLQRAVLIMVLLNAFSTSLMLSAANVALPTIAADLSLDAVALSWVPMAYLMASAMFVLAFGKLADTWGRKRFFLIGTVAVIITSIAAALSVNATMLLSARFLQGVSAAMLYATQIALVSSVYPAQQRGKMIGQVVSAIYIGLAVGPLLGGYAIDLLGWRASFLLQIPLALVGLLLGIFKVKGEWLAETRTRFDTPGAIIYALGILFFCLGISRLPALDGFVLVAAAAATITIFVRHARRTPFPIWDVKLFFNNRAFTLSCAASLIMYSTTYGNVVLLSLYLQYLKGMSASAAGTIMMLQPITMAILSPLTGRLSDRVEPRILASLGMFITAVGLLMLAMLSSSSSILRVALALLMTGVGFSLFSSPNVNAIMGSVAPRHYGSASAAVATTRLIGQLSSIVLVTLALTLIMGSRPISPETYPQLEQSIRLSFSIAAALCIPGILLSLVRGRIHTISNEA